MLNQSCFFIFMVGLKYPTRVSVNYNGNKGMIGIY